MGGIIVGVYCVGDDADSVCVLQVWTDVEEDE